MVGEGDAEGKRDDDRNSEVDSKCVDVQISITVSFTENVLLILDPLPVALRSGL